MLIIESQQQIYRGIHYCWPTEKWDTGFQAWLPYKGDAARENGWGDIITLEEAKEFMEPF